MYGYEYEFDFLLCLRLLKFLHMQSPEAAKRVVEIYKELDTEEIGIVMEEILWDIFSDAEFDTDEFNELTIVYFSHRDIDRLYELGRQESTFQKIIAGVASADSVVQFQRINLSIADNTAGFMLLHNKGVA